jgi:hypothetical protein
MQEKNKIFDFIYQTFPHMKAEDINHLINLNSKEELKQLAENHGYDDNTIKDIFGK